MSFFSRTGVCNRRTFTGLAMASAFGLSTTKARGAERPGYHVLEDQQTPVRDQGNRGTCYVHSVVAALEAAYRRAGRGELNFSEEFANYMLRMLWLEPRPNVKVHPAERENRYTMGAGGFSDGVVRLMVEGGFAIPEEKAMPYRGRANRGTTDPSWYTQFGADSFNLDPSNFDGSALAKSKCYGIKKHHDIKGNDPTAIEDELLAGREVIWDYTHAGDRSGPIWEFNGLNYDRNTTFGHSVLIYGFDRDNLDRPHFVVKNSWGKKGTYVSYEYLRRYGKRASSIVEVAEPKTWAELAYLGRWSLDLNGRKGVLDLYHLPSMSLTAFESENLIDPKTGKLMEDRRFGTYFRDGKPFEAHRVNGEFTGDGLKLNLDWNEPGCSYSHRGGQTFTLRFIGGGREYMKGEILTGDGKGATVTAIRQREAKDFPRG